MSKQHPKEKGLAAPTTNPLGTSTSKAKFTDNSAHNQQLKLLDYLLERGAITTREAREKLDIYHPPARIKELRNAGYLINTVMVNWTSEYEIKHRIAKYVLIQKMPIENDIFNEVAA